MGSDKQRDRMILQRYKTALEVNFERATGMYRKEQKDEKMVMQ